MPGIVTLKYLPLNSSIVNAVPLDNVPSIPDVGEP